MAVCLVAAALGAIALLLFLGRPDAAAAEEQLVVCREPDLAIPDGNPNGIVDTLVISSDLTLVSAQVDVTIPEAWVGDLTIALKKVGDGPSVTLLDRLGVWDGSTYGCGAYALNAQFADDAALAATESCVPGTITGRLRPALPLALLAGRPLEGTWQLTVTDHAAGITGQLERWCLHAVAAPGPHLDVAPAEVSAWVAPGQTGTSTVTLHNGGSASWQWGAAPAAAGGELLLSEGFEASGMPPAGWQRLTQLPAAGWRLMAGGGRGATQAAMVPFADEPQDEWLISPPLWMQRGWLTLWSRGSVQDCRGSPRCDLEVYLLGEAIGTVLVGRADEAWLADGAWTAHAWELTPYLPTTRSVQIGIRYLTEGYSPAVRIDDVLVSGLERPPGCRAPQPEWLSVEPFPAPLFPGARATLSLALDAGSLGPSTYQGTVCLAGNDPLRPLQPLPISLHVDGCAALSPPAPTLTVRQGAGSGAVLSWPTAPGQAAYRLFRGSQPYALTPWLELSGGSESATDPAPGQAAFYRLEAGNCSRELWSSSQRAGWMTFNLYKE